MLSTLIAVLATLLGSASTYLFQQAARRAERREDLRRERLSAVAALVSALADHRRAMWVREDLRMTGDAPAAYAAARAESHATRAAVSGPLTLVCILAPGLADQAKAAAEAAYALRGAPDPAGLDTRRTAAITAADRLIASAGASL